MARRNDVLGVMNAETVIGTGVVAEGKLTSEGDIVIDGRFTGDLEADGNLTLGINSIIKADIKAGNVVVHGTLRGDINASGEVSISETGRVIGNITSLNLAINSGGIFQGRSKMQSPPRLGDPAPESTKAQI